MLTIRKEDFREYKLKWLFCLQSERLLGVSYFYGIIFLNIKSCNVFNDDYIKSCNVFNDDSLNFITNPLLGSVTEVLASANGNSI